MSHLISSQKVAYNVAAVCRQRCIVLLYCVRIITLVQLFIISRIISILMRKKTAELLMNC